MPAKTKGAAAKAPRGAAGKAKGSADKPNNGNLFDIARVLISSGIKTEPQDTVVAMSTPTPLRKRMLLPGESPDVEAAPCTSAKRVRGKRIMSGSPDIEAQDVPAPKVTAPQAAAPEVTAPQAAAPQVATSDAPAPSARAKQEQRPQPAGNEPQFRLRDVGTGLVLANGPASLLSGLMSEMGGSPASTEEADFLRRLEVAMLAKAREEIMHLQKRQANEVPATAAAGPNPATLATPGTEAAAEAAAPATPSFAAPMLDETAETSASAPMAEAMADEEPLLMPGESGIAATKPTPLPKGVMRPKFANRDERKKVWKRYLRTLEPNDERAARIEKAPDDFVARMLSKHEQSYYFAVWCEHGRSWGKVRIFEEHLHLERNLNEKRFRWLTEAQMLDLYCPYRSLGLTI